MNPLVLASHRSFVVTFLASVLVWFMALGLIILWVIDGKIKKEQVLHAVFASLLAWLLSQMIKSIFPFPRPFVTNGMIPLTITIPTDSAFPSGHASFAFGMATSVWLHDKRTGFIFIILACLVGFGRIASNVHYLTDVLAGTFLGVSSAIAVAKVHLNKLI
jgi:undecaprenyl-diphosphatase